MLANSIFRIVFSLRPVSLHEDLFLYHRGRRRRRGSGFGMTAGNRATEEASFKPYIRQPFIWDTLPVS